MIRTAHPATSRPPGWRCEPSGAAGRGLRAPKRVCLYLAYSFRGFDGPRGALRNGFLSLTGPVNLKKRISDASLEDSRREKHGPWTAGPAFRCHKGAPGNPVNTRGNALRGVPAKGFSNREGRASLFGRARVRFVADCYSKSLRGRFPSSLPQFPALPASGNPRTSMPRTGILVSGFRWAPRGPSRGRGWPLGSTS